MSSSLSVHLTSINIVFLINILHFAVDSKKCSLGQVKYKLFICHANCTINIDTLSEWSISECLFIIHFTLIQMITYFFCMFPSFSNRWRHIPIWHLFFFISSVTTFISQIWIVIPLENWLINQLIMKSLYFWMLFRNYFSTCSKYV